MLHHDNPSNNNIGDDSKVSSIKKINLIDNSSNHKEYIASERNAAIYELTQSSNLHPTNDASQLHSPYEITISIESSRLNIQICGNNNDTLQNFILSLKPYRSIIKDYFLIVQSYEKTRLSGNKEKLSPIDIARRAIHNEGAEKLQTRLQDKITMDQKTARRIFTLICVLHIGKTRNIII